MIELLVLVAVVLLGAPLALLVWYAWREKSWRRWLRRD